MTGLSTYLCQVLTGTEASGTLLTLSEPVSFWGGVDSSTGVIVDRNHPQVGTSLVGRAVVMGATRGSSSSSSTLLECVRLGRAPSILILTARDPILVIGAAVAWEVYGRGPVVAILEEPIVDADGLPTRVDESGQLLIDHLC